MELLDIRKNLLVRFECDFGSGFLAGADDLEIGRLAPSLEFHVVDFAVAADLDF